MRLAFFKGLRGFGEVIEAVFLQRKGSETAPDLHFDNVLCLGRLQWTGNFFELRRLSCQRRLVRSLV
jgi:hypothetical protein